MCGFMVPSNRLLGQATILMSPSRDSASHIQLLEQVIRQFPADRWLIVEDNLSIHKSRQTRLAFGSLAGDSHAIHSQIRLLAEPD